MASVSFFAPGTTIAANSFSSSSFTCNRRPNGISCRISTLPVAPLVNPQALLSRHTPRVTPSLPSTSNVFLPALSPCRRLPSVSRQPLRVTARSDDSVSAPQRVIAAAGYFLPLLDGIRYGRYLFLQYPASYAIFQPIFPLIKAYSSFPYAGFLAFFVLYLGVIQNQSLSRYVRYNCMQAIILDILIILPALVERLIAPTGGVGIDLIILMYNTVFIYLFACFVFGVGSCLFGKTPRLPIVADAADAQVPF